MNGIFKPSPFRLGIHHSSPQICISLNPAPKMPLPNALDKYPHREQSIAVAGRELRLLVPTDPDRIFFEMGPEDFGKEEKLPHWARLWPGALALGEFLLQTGLEPGCRVLDLGCGLALNGIIAAQMGADVLASDWFAEALDFALANAHLNGTHIRAEWMDWNAPPPGLQLDLLLGADLLYERRNHVPLLDFIRQTVVAGGQAWLSDHGRPHLPDFRHTLAEQGWVYQETMLGRIHIFVLEVR